MPRIGDTEQAVVLRTDFSDEACWRSVRAEVLAETVDGFRAYVDVIEDPEEQGADQIEPLGCVVTERCRQRGFPVRVNLTRSGKAWAVCCKRVQARPSGYSRPDEKTARLCLPGKGSSISSFGSKASPRMPGSITPEVGARRWSWLI